MKAELQQLVALQNLDKSIRKLQAEIEAIPQGRAEIEKEFDQRAFEIRALENRRDEARHERVRLEAEIAEQRSRAERAERNLMSSKKQEEYTAAIREADAARKQILALETQVLEQMEIFEQSEAALNERASEVASLNSDREERLKAFDEESNARVEGLAAARAERERVFNSLPKSMSVLYTRISNRIRDGVAVAEARGGACMACFMALRPQMMAEVRRGEEVVTCDNCNRILYYVPTDPAATNSASARPKLATT
ncbi:MAG TPA: C4-type zinc ribbon domain-containing protein [Pyrinomonadaceae bacterium]|nr:C4-type zinc ribbon domain-containing protein [Pyrinomonadaceae bacterium]